ncbi:hypothetical protein F385_4294 [Pantoea agglomerans 299R]|nr:hypothetical protein F385_4294 [Pantoea agglomerans 299R]
MSEQTVLPCFSHGELIHLIAAHVSQRFHFSVIFILYDRSFSS